MPTSRHKPPMNVVRDFYRNKGMDRQADVIGEAVETTRKDRSTLLKARKTAKAKEMVSGGLCKSLKLA